MMKNRIKPVLLILALLTQSVTVRAAAPKVSVDEAVYVNLDYYGEVEEVNVVKTCSMNGQNTITDYGDYTEVINMTNKAAPVSDGEKIYFDLSGYDCDTFYFEGRSKELKTELPWNIDVSYLLNGKEASADKLAGASGMVSTIIKAVPNKKASEYLKNNMVLAVVMAVDMEKDNYSLEAPGSQLQSMGTKKVALFMALPGEEGNFRVDVGTDSYESLGVFMTMIPATMSSLDRISDFREVKNKVRNSMDAMSDSADVIFDALRDMKDSLQETQEGLRRAKDAKAVVDSGKDAVKRDVDALIDSLSAMESSLENLQGQTGVESRDISSAMEELETIRGSVYSMDKYIKDMEDVSKELESSLNSLKKALKNAEDESGALAEVKKTLEGAASQGADISAGEIANAGLTAQLGLLAGQLSGEAAPALSDTEDLIHELENLLGKSSEVLNETNALGGRMTSEYKDHLLELMDMMESFLYNSRVSVAAARTSMRSMRNLMDAAEGSLSAAIDGSLSGMIGILDGTVNITEGSEVFRNAKDVMKNAVDDELDELEEDSNILNIDTSLELPSFTSLKNPTPKSLQVILRTGEISIDDDAKVLDAEQPEVPLTLGGRIKAVFKRMFGRD